MACGKVETSSPERSSSCAGGDPAHGFTANRWSLTKFGAPFFSALCGKVCNWKV